MMAEGYFLELSNENALKLIKLKIAQVCDDIKNHELYTLNRCTCGV